MWLPLFSQHEVLRTVPWGPKAARILAAALEAVEPGAAISRHIQRQGQHLLVNGKAYDLRSYHRVWMVGAGKASAPMANRAAELLGESLTGGLIIVKEGYTGDLLALPDRLNLVEAGHPIPDHRGVTGAGQMAEMLANLNHDDLVICLISGGGSALLVSPVPGISLSDLQSLTTALLASGASIDEINTLRKHLEQLKGGGLARLASPASLVTLILSDVVGDRLDVIASGPTVPDPTTFADAWKVLERYNLLDQIPASLIHHLQRGRHGEVQETPKPGDPLFEKTQNLIIGNNRQAALAAIHQAREEGLHCMLLTTHLQGEARQAGRFLAAIAHQIADSGEPIPRPACIVIGGETTVSLTGDGLGGRNQELALGAVADLAGLDEVALITLATDGGDGPTDAAGAIVTGQTLERARALGIEPARFLSHNDAYHFFDPLGNLIRTGPTQTNVTDLVFLFAF
jgi:hydroxypyruvate reductase